ncbi:MAG: PilZ domain-containing protein [Kofleriaceae bacterium]
MDKREAVRVPVQVRARCRSEGLVVDGLVEDVSKSGLFMRVDLTLEEGCEAELDLDLPGEETLHLPVRVVRVEDAGMAVKFGESIATARAKMPLANFIMKQHQDRH